MASRMGCENSVTHWGWGVAVFVGRGDEVGVLATVGVRLGAGVSVEAEMGVGVTTDVAVASSGAEVGVEATELQATKRNVIVLIAFKIELTFIPVSSAMLLQDLFHLAFCITDDEFERHLPRE